MSSAVVSTSAAQGRLFVFDAGTDPEVCALYSPQRAEHARVQESPVARLQSAINRQSKIPPASVTPASRLEVRLAPEMVSTGISAIDALTGGGLPRGCLTEICGSASSGRTTILLAALAAATGRGEFCAVVDAGDALDPQSVADAGVVLDRLLWVRCGEGQTTKNGVRRKKSTGNPLAKFDEAGSRPAEQRLEQLLRTADLLLESGGFGLVALDLSDLPLAAARRIPLATWFRLRRVVEHTPTILLAIEQQPIAGSCSSLVLKLAPPDTQLFCKFAAQTNDDSIFALDQESAAERRKNAARGASRGFEAKSDEAPEGRKKIYADKFAASLFAAPAHTQLFAGLEISAELFCSRLQRKPATSVAFASKTAWAG